MCTACQAGTYENGLHTACLDCDPGYVSDAGATQCDACDPGTYESNNVCLYCPAGTANPLPAQTVCPDCDPGYVSDVGATVCDACDPGTYESDNECILCAAGTANPLPAQTVCPDCEPGTFTGGQGRTECSNCAPGSHASEFGSTSCKLCKAGFYATNWGQAGCSACLPGHTSEPGAERCFYAGIGGSGSSGVIPVADGERVKLPCNPECVILELPTGLQAEFCGLCGYSASIAEELEETIPFDMPEGVTMVRGMTVGLFDEDGELVPEVPAVATLKFSYPLGDLSPDLMGIQLWDPAGEEWVNLIDLLKPLGRLEAYVAWPGTSLLIK